MPRPPRIDFPDAVYHVTSRGNGRADIFRSDEDRRRFLAQLAHHLYHCAVDLYAFVLMDNHFHGLVRTPRANLSRFMQRLLSSYALYARYKHHRPGHLFQGRFKAKLVEDEVYLLAVTRYIHLNPVKIAVCRRLSASERLARLEAYPWSSYGGYAAAKNALEFVNYDVLREYGPDMAAARRHYRAYVHACLMEDDGLLIEAMAANRYAIGGTTFIERTEERIEQRRTGRVQDEDVDLPRRTVSLEEIDGAVAHHYRVDAVLLSAHGRRVGSAKSVAVELAAQLADLSGRAIGEHYGICANAVVANRRRLATRPEVLQVIETLGRRLRKRKLK
ncbi:MAG: transposase [Rhodopirellula sp.]|nr:transposase [Rhodopirellula sp.]